MITNELKTNINAFRVYIRMNDLPIVPFGKYKGKQVTELLHDYDYISWLKLQPWLEKYPVIQNIILLGREQTVMDQPTPEHNKLQNMFLEESIREKFIDIVFPGRRDAINKLNAEQVVKVLFGEIKSTTEVLFEEKGWDVVIHIPTVKIDVVPERKWRLTDKFCSRAGLGEITSFYKLGDEMYFSCCIITEYNVARRDVDSSDDSDDEHSYPRHRVCTKIVQKAWVSSPTFFSVYFELKTTIGDDYPCVLRKMKKQMEYSRIYQGYRKCDNYWKEIVLLVKEFCASSVDKENMVKIFKSSGIAVIFMEDVLNNTN